MGSVVGARGSGYAMSGLSCRPASSTDCSSSSGVSHVCSPYAAARVPLAPCGSRVRGSGFGVWGLGFGVRGLGFGVSDLSR